MALFVSLLSLQAGSVERIKVHGASLEGNLSGDSPDRDVSIYLPASYKTDTQRRYPVVYFLHGFTDDDAKWYGFTKHWISLPAVLNEGKSEIIFVTPNAYTRFQGSMYSSSVTTGDWETYVAKELVAYVDSHYRTLANAASRGLAGHSMGGYGTLRIGMKYPDVFSSIYALSPCCLTSGLNMEKGPGPVAKAEAVATTADVEKADFITKAMLASGAAWSPNPGKPPLFLSLPWQGGEFHPEIAAKWSANSPLVTLDQHIRNLKRLGAIAFDAGTEDKSIAASIKILDAGLSTYNIPHTYQTYQGNHVDHIAERIATKMLPFFAGHLKH